MPPLTPLHLLLIIITMKRLLLASGVCLLVPLLPADVVLLYSGNDDLAGIDNRFESDGSTFVVATVDGSGVFGSGDALRIADLSALDKPEAVWSTAPSITDGFRIDMKAANNGFVSGSSVDINLRFTNTGLSASTQSNVFATISFEADSLLKVNGSSIGDFSGGPLDLSFVINNSDTNALTYTLFGEEKTLAANSINTYIGGVLADADRSITPGASYVSASGIGILGFIGESDSKMDADYLFDDITLYTGADISTSAVPEPSTYALLLGFLGLGWVVARRRRKA